MARGGGGGVRRWHGGGAVARGGRDGATAQLRPTPRRETVAAAQLLTRPLLGCVCGGGGERRGWRTASRDGRAGGALSAETAAAAATAVRSPNDGGGGGASSSRHCAPRPCVRVLRHITGTSGEWRRYRAGVNARGGARARRTRARCLSVVCCCRVKSRLRTCADGAREPAGGLWQRGRRRVGSYDPRTDARWLRRPLDRRRRCTCAGTGGWWSAA